MPDVTPAQTRAARALLAWSQQDLAREARVGASTVADFERGFRTPIANNAEAIQSALEEAGISFLPGGAVVGPPPPISQGVEPGGTPVRWIDATDLSQWADRRDGQEGMADLLTRLVRAGLGLSARLEFPSDESVQFSGWDGTCYVERGTVYVPDGASGWEIGTQRAGIKGKADDDYQKRSENPLGLDKRKSTFCFVTPRRWPKKGEWVQARCAERQWADVRAFDADDLVHWIELYPAVGHWLAIRVGKRPLGVQQLDEAWDEWSLSTQRPLSTDLILAGRDEEATRILRWLRESPSLIAVQAEAADEAIAFFHAAIHQLPKDYHLQYYSRCLVANDVETARRLGDSLSPSIIVLQDAEPGVARRLVERGHHVYLPRGPEPGGYGSTIPLPRATRYEIESALTGMGIESDQSRNLARDSGRSLAVLRRLIPSAPGRIPEWAKGVSPRALMGALLAGAWDEEVEGDRTALEKLTGLKYEVIVAELTPLVGFLEKPLRKVGTVWKIASPRDAWFRIATHISPVDVKRFESLTIDVFSSKDPRFEMQAAERWLAALHNIRPEYSSYLRHGVGETLILFSLFGSQASNIQNTSSEVETIVAEILENADAQRWWSLSRDFQLLAEAAPEAFLSVLDKELDNDKSAISVLFGEDDGGITGTEYVSNLLWALESLAWSPRYFSHVAILLAKLASRDPGGRYGNRPKNSLRALFLLWLPQTFVPLNGRMRVLDQLRKIEPEVAWALMLAILPKGHDSASPAAHTRWRDLSADRREEVTYPLIGKGADEITQRLLADVGSRIVHWNELISALANLSPDRRRECIGLLSSVAPRIRDDDDRMVLSDALRRLLNHHRSFPDAEWALPSSELDMIANVYIALEPENLIKRFVWLFGSNAQLPSPEPAMRNREHIDKACERGQGVIADEQKKATGLIFAQGGTAALFELAGAAENAYYVGQAIANLPLDEQQLQKIITEALVGPSRFHEAAGAGIVQTTYHSGGQAAAVALLEWAISKNLGAEAVLRLLRALPAERWVWEQAASIGTEIENAYWKTQYIMVIRENLEDLIFAVEKLIAADRAVHAIQLVGHSLSNKLPATLLVQLLKRAVTEPQISSSVDTMFQYYVIEIFKRLDVSNEISDQQMAQLEWSYLPLFRFSDRQPRALQNALATDPAFFVQVLSALYKPSPESGIAEEPPEDMERARAVADQAHDLLMNWSRLPGTVDGGDVDGALLETWIKEARQLAAAVGRREVADLSIGRILATTPRRGNELWPPLAVREVIEAFRSRDLEQGFVVGVHNSRGVTSRGMTDGGSLERDLAKYYHRCAEETALEWHRTSGVLEQIAASYEHEAERHDDDAERNQW